MSYIILGIMLGVIAIIIMKVKKYYYEVSEKELTERMKKRLYNIQNNVETEDVQYMKNVMRDLDELEKDRVKEPKFDESSLTPTAIVTQINMATNTGVSRINELFMDLYDEYIKPVFYKIKKTVT
jgi:hypothetical protein